LARAKRTDRAEARRQYRAYLASQQDAEAAAAAEGAAEESQTRPPASRRPVPQGASSAPRPGERMGMLQAARAATRNATYLTDVRDIVWLVTKTRAVWPVAVLCSAGVVIAYPRIHSNLDVASDPILGLVFQFVVYPMALLPPMLAGFLAPRATWLAGALAAMISTLLFIFVVATTPIATVPESALAAASAAASAAAASAAPSAGAAASAAPTTAPSATAGTGATTVALITPDEVPGAALGWLVSGIPFGALIGAGAGWYRRFLDNIGPRGGAPRKPQPKRPVKKQPVRR
jgi:hypothetical protein